MSRIYRYARNQTNGVEDRQNQLLVLEQKDVKRWKKIT